MKNKNAQEIINSLLGLSIGSFVVALGITSFLEPYNLAPGGLTGFAMALKALTNIPIYMTNIFINVPLFLGALLTLGRDFGWKSFFSVSILTIFLKYMSFKLYTPNIVFGSIVGGLMLGLGIGTVISFGGTTGGTDLLAMIIKKYFYDIKIGNVLLIIDSCIVIFAVIVNKDIVLALFSVIAMVISSRTVNLVVHKDLYGRFTNLK